ncbi:hypothetical protein [Cohnella candidum]|uniref:Uncharacterized protein n=1 Tax=Cohnella candidum TaxID=2674991 RepID=A0A3G3JT34_9BACL|nr:hypothetical protein [Cohnella candidum]AYQ71385.1 hypothetical protein EAV92_01545 [Cohnella candidum]
MVVAETKSADGFEQEKWLDELIEEIRARHLQPEDRYEVTAILESFGWNDERARMAFGVQDVFELASLIWDKMQQSILFTPFAPIEKQKLGRLIFEIIQQFFRGMIFALPMAVSVLSMLTLKFSLWSYENLSVATATAIGIGTIASFIIVGGFTQAIARRGFFYIMLGYYNMARKMTFYFIRLGFLVCIGVCLLLYGVNVVFNLFPYAMISIAILYFFFLNTIWLSVTVYYILRKELVFTCLIVLGIFLVWLFFDVFKMSIIVSQLIALLVVSFLSLMLVAKYFSDAERKMEKGIAPQMPRISITLFSTMPYFIYGFIYFSFLFVDRVFSWSTPDSFIPYIVWFRGPYEIGLDFALLVLIVPMGISEVVVSKLIKDIYASQKGYMGTETKAMNQRFLRMYLKMSAWMAAISVVSALLLYMTAKAFFVHHPQSIGLTLFTNPTTHFVFLWGLTGYVLIASALLNAVILFSLSQPALVAKAIIPAFGVNMIVGFLATRWAHFGFGHDIGNNPGYTYAVFGLVAGGILFVWLSTRNVWKVLSELDYYMYAAS